MPQAHHGNRLHGAGRSGRSSCAMFTLEGFVDQITSEAGSQGSAWADRRRALLAMGGAGLLAAFAGHSTAEAKKKKNKNKNKNKKKCNKEKNQCTSQVETFCVQFEEETPECEAALLPCCATCNVAVGVICVAEFFTSDGPVEVASGRRWGR